jgi:ATP-dependent exoDNAse (exonuclease V) alpha subunit
VLTPISRKQMYHLSVKPVSRSSGRSATAAIAYRTAEKIIDERTNQLHDYTKKQGVVHEEILLPPNSPDWANDREKLWNAAEAAEKRKDARVAREYEVAIPKELTKEQGIELVRDFGKVIQDRYGVAVDIAVHKDHARDWQGEKKDFEGYHAHVMTTTRKMEKEGLGEKADIELSDSKRASLGLGKGSDEIEKVREMWEFSANKHLEMANQEKRIDRRSLKEQGIEREPTQHLGPHATSMERRGEKTDIGDINRSIELAYQRGLEDRQRLAALNPQLIELDTDIQKALKEREKVKELTTKLERGANDFVKKYEEMIRQKELEKQRQLELEKVLERSRSRGRRR